MPQKPARHRSQRTVERGDPTGMQFVPVEDCWGDNWLASPDDQTVYYLASLSKEDAMHAIIDGMKALALPPKLSLIRGLGEDGRRDGNTHLASI